MKLTKALPIIAFILGLMIGCGSDKKGGGAATPPPKSCSGDECPSGQPDNPGSFDPQKASLWSGTLRIQDKPTYRAFLKDYFRLCDNDPYEGNPWVIWSFWVDTNPCSAWDNQGEVVIQFASGELPVDAAIYLTAQHDNFAGSAELPVLRGTFHPTNNNTSMELRRLGFTWGFGYDDTFQAKSEMGSSLEKGRLLLRFYYQGNPFGYVDLIPIGNQ